MEKWERIAHIEFDDFVLHFTSVDQFNNVCSVEVQLSPIENVTPNRERFLFFNANNMYKCVSDWYLDCFFGLSYDLNVTGI